MWNAYNKNENLWFVSSIGSYFLDCFSSGISDCFIYKQRFNNTIKL